MRLSLLLTFLLISEPSKVRLPDKVTDHIFCLSCLTIVDAVTEKLRLSSGEAEIVELLDGICDNIYHGRFFPKYNSHDFWRGCMLQIREFLEETEQAFVSYARNRYPFYWVETEVCLKVSGACQGYEADIEESRERTRTQTMADVRPPKGETQWGALTNWDLRKKKEF